MDGGEGMFEISKMHLGCATARNKSTCDNRLGISREALERTIRWTYQIVCNNLELKSLTAHTGAAKRYACRGLRAAQKP